MTKTCTNCCIVKNINDFHKDATRYDGYYPQCKKCRKRYVRTNKPGTENTRKCKANYKMNKCKVNFNKIYKYLLDRPCVDCGEKDPIVLEFDHVRGKKTWNISRMMTFPWETILKEIAKCDVRCVNCHRRRTAVQLNWYKNYDWYNEIEAQTQV